MAYQIALRDTYTGKFIPTHPELQQNLAHACTWPIDQADAEAILATLREWHRTGREWEITIVNR